MEGGKESFPATAVYGDDSDDCKLLVATYYDSSSDVATDNKLGQGAQGSQVDKDGYVYYGYGYNYSPFEVTWQWDNNEYKLLLEKGVRDYELLDIKLDT